VEPPELPYAERWVLKKLYSSGALFSELLGSTVFIRPGAVGTRGAPGVALRREASAGAQGTRADPEAALSREVGTGASGTRSAPELPRAGRRAWTRGAPGAASSRSIVGCFW
jgi:hypothetical protein